MFGLPPHSMIETASRSTSYPSAENTNGSTSFSVIPWDSIIGFETTDPITHETVQNDYWWNLGWWFPELTALFLVAAVVVGLVAGFGEKEITGNNTQGFRDFIGAGIAVVLARGVTVILNNTQTIDTILSWMEDAVSGTDVAPDVATMRMFVRWCPLQPRPGSSPRRTAMRSRLSGAGCSTPWRR